jgi:hypothetical protein
LSRETKRRNDPPGGAEPLSPQRKWRAIALATVLLVPAFWAILAGLVSGSDVAEDGPNAPAAFALGLALIPFVFMVLAFLSAHPRAPGAVVRAMGLTLLVGIPVSALAADGATGIVAGVGAGGIVALRSDPPHTWQSRAVAVAIGAAYTFVLLRTAGAIALLPAPVFPFTGIALADHFVERKNDRSRPRA